MKKIISISCALYILCLCSCNFKKKPSIEYSEDIGRKELRGKETVFCEILDSLAKKTSSIPYDTYRGTPYLKKDITKVGENKIVYHFYEDYPEYDDDGFYNGGMITLRYIILRKKPTHSSVITIKSNNSLVDINTSKIIKVREDIFLISTLEYFNEGDPFYEDIIDFYVSVEGDIFDFFPELIGVYWANLKDYYDKNKCN